MKVLITRTDKLGDTVLSLPVWSDLKAARPDWSLHALVAPGSLPLVENDPHLDGVWTWAADDPPAHRRQLRDRLATAGFDAAVMLHYRRELAWLLLRAGIRRRYGPWSKPTSWLLLDRGAWQGRSRSGRHEAEYNVQLGRRLLDAGTGRPPPLPALTLTPAQRELGRRFRSEEAGSPTTLAFVHPGSGGSALDWEPARFAGVANGLAADDGCAVFVTGTGRDAAAVQALRPFLDARVGVLLDRFDLRDFLGVLSAGDLFVGGSTGPLHLAAALDLAAVGLYPPVATMSPERWGPLSPRCATLVPAVVCPARRVCRGRRCALYNCLDALTVAEVLAAARRMLAVPAVVRTKEMD